MTVFRLLSSAVSDVDSGRFDDAIGKLRAAHQYDPLELAWLLDEAFPGDAGSWFDVAAADETKDSYYSPAALLASRDRDDDAIEFLRRSDEMGAPGAALRWAELLLWHGRHSEPESRLREYVAAREDGFEYARALLGVIYFERDERNDDEVVALLTSVPEVPDEFVSQEDQDTIRVVLANLFLARQELEQAKSVLIDLIDRIPKRVGLTLGNLLWDDFDDFEGAERAYRQGLVAGDCRCAYNLGLLLEEHGRVEEALSLYQEAASGGDRLATDRLAAERLAEDEG